MGEHHFSLQVLAELDPAAAAAAAGACGCKPLNEHVALRPRPARRHGHDRGARGSGARGRVLGAAAGEFRACARARRRSPRATSRPWRPSTTTRAGAPRGNHWGEALALLCTSARSPYHFSLHASDPADPDGGSRKDTGHTFICGPTGSGKTVFIGFLVALLQRHGATQVVFDKDRGLEILVRALGGEYLPLRERRATGFNPLQLPVDAAARRVPEDSGCAPWCAPATAAAVGARERRPRSGAARHAGARAAGAAPVAARRVPRCHRSGGAARAPGALVRAAPAATTPGCSTIARGLGRARGSPGTASIGFDVTEFLDHELTRAPRHAVPLPPGAPAARWSAAGVLDGRVLAAARPIRASRASPRMARRPGAS